MRFSHRIRSLHSLNTISSLLFSMLLLHAGAAQTEDFRKDIILELYNEAGQLVLAWKIYRCWVSEYQALPDLDANANAVAISRLKLENEGWERDYSTVEPTEPSFTEPVT